MPSHSDLATRLLQDAAGFFVNIGEQNPPLQEQMASNADIFKQVASLVATDPTGELPANDGQDGTPAQSHAVLAARLLRDAATFFENIGEQNPDLKEQMTSNADIYTQVANLVETDPTGDLPTENGETVQ
jgi:hypothetical protein